MVQLRRWIIALIALALIWLVALMVKTDLSEADFAAASVQPFGALAYLAASLFVWWSLSFLLGVAVGWSTWVFAPARFGDGAVALVWIAFLLLLAIAVADVTPVQVDFWLEGALLMFFVYWLGCALGWALRGFAAMELHEALANRADARGGKQSHGGQPAQAPALEDATASPRAVKPMASPRGSAAETTSTRPTGNIAPATAATRPVEPAAAAIPPAREPEQDRAVSAAPHPNESLRVSSADTAASVVGSPTASAVHSPSQTAPHAAPTNDSPAGASQIPPETVADDGVVSSESTDKAVEAATPAPAETVGVSPAAATAIPTSAGLEELVPAAAGSAVAAPVPDSKKYAGTQPPGLVAPRESKPDNLQRIRGIGPQNEGRLNGLGVWHFDQIAAWTPEHALWIGSYLAFPGRIQREGWIAQAAELAAGRAVSAPKAATPKRTAANKTPT